MAGLSRSPTPSSRVLAAKAVRAAIADAGLKATDIDGLIVCRSGGATESELGLNVQSAAALLDLRLMQVLHAEGASSIIAIQTAALAVTAGLAKSVVCVFSDAQLQGRATRESFGRIKSTRGIEGLRYAAGLFGGSALFAMAARRYMADCSVSQEQLGAVALAARQWAMMNPLAIFREPLDMNTYLSARWIAEPFRLYDCAVPVNGAIAVVVTADDRAKDLRHPPLHILGMGQAHLGSDRQNEDSDGARGAEMVRDAAFKMASVTRADITMCQFYDPFTYVTLATLEGYGFCKRGEAGDFVASGAIGPGGSLPVNTGGGHLSGYYLQGMTPISEAVLQMRGQAGARQCDKCDVVLVTNIGGLFEHQACLVLGSYARDSL